jgi:hypothetical protein
VASRVVRPLVDLDFGGLDPLLEPEPLVELEAQPTSTRAEITVASRSLIAKQYPGAAAFRVGCEKPIA